MTEKLHPNDFCASSESTTWGGWWRVVNLMKFECWTLALCWATKMMGSLLCQPWDWLLMVFVGACFVHQMVHIVTPTGSIQNQDTICMRWWNECGCGHRWWQFFSKAKERGCLSLGKAARLLIAGWKRWGQKLDLTISHATTRHVIISPQQTLRCLNLLWLACNSLRRSGKIKGKMKNLEEK